MTAENLPLHFQNFLEQRESNLSQEELDHAIAHAVNWNELEKTSRVLTQYETKVEDIILNALGYVPHKAFCIPHELFLREIASRYHLGKIEPEEFIRQVEFHVKQIRNADFKYSGWAKTRDFTSDEYARYDLFLPQYKKITRNRVEKLLGYSPLLRCSLEAELALREFVHYDDFKSEQWQKFDYKYLGIIKYKEVLLTQGEDGANDLELCCLIHKRGQDALSTPFTVE